MSVSDLVPLDFEEAEAGAACLGAEGAGLLRNDAEDAQPWVGRLAQRQVGRLGHAHLGQGVLQALGADRTVQLQGGGGGER